MWGERKDLGLLSLSYRRQDHCSSDETYIPRTRDLPRGLKNELGALRASTWLLPVAEITLTLERN
jgi:hypothetical protein